MDLPFLPNLALMKMGITDLLIQHWLKENKNVLFVSPLGGGIGYEVTNALKQHASHLKVQTLCYHEDVYEWEKLVDLIADDTELLYIHKFNRMDKQKLVQNGLCELVQCHSWHGLDPVKDKKFPNLKMVWASSDCHEDITNIALLERFHHCLSAL